MMKFFPHSPDLHFSPQSLFLLVLLVGDPTVAFIHGLPKHKGVNAIVKQVLNFTNFAPLTLRFQRLG
uniref:Uncharacterized protein n=1 Tax=Gossypium raimondii TaxID=29730 RepID=A0A0D2SAV3_GOSRA|nr:hypothetical protein B456_013G088100 [Gossypium raimondii]